MNTISKMKLTKASIVTFSLLALALIFTSAQSGKGDDGLKIGKKMPLSAESMDAADGESYTLDDLMGENGLIVVFSCNTCPFVVGSDNFPGWEGQYNEINAKATENKMGMVLINSNAAKREGVDSKEEMKAHAEAQGYEMPYLVDVNAQLADAMGAKTTPHVYVFGSDSKLIYKGSIDNSWDTKSEELETYLIDVIDAVAAGNTIKNNSTTPRGCSIKRSK